jgi:[glutamine synthetase] adenylyltransferase / [glutamine synthetase]-adenylyl-L-tyrosine phosphorylase
MASDQEKHPREAAVRAASRSLGAFLDTDPEALDTLLADAPLPDRSGYIALAQGAAAGGEAELRRVKRRLLLGIAGRDLTGEIGLEEVGRGLADLADACLAATLTLIDAPAELGVVAMGKLGGRELNYSSDIDVMFVSDGDPVKATKDAERVLQVLGEFAPEGQAYRIDTNLRPEGRDGALVRSLDGYLEYYKRWAKPWEYQALIKARAAAGDEDVVVLLIEATRPLVFPESVTPERIASIREIKERVESHALRSARRARGSEIDDVKLGPGGIRDIEFSVQLLQMVHGGSDPSVRGVSTLDTLSALVDGGYVAEDDAAGLSVAYRWLRNVEHRVQLWQERQVHVLPKDEEGRARLARVMGFRDTPAASALTSFEQRHRAVLSDVRGRFERLFYRPMIESLAGIGPRLSDEALKDRLQVLGFRDVDRAARTLAGLVGGTTRRSKLFRVLTPAMLRSLASTPLPDEGLFSFLRLGEALESRLDVLSSLRDNPPAIAFLASVLGNGRLLGDVLTHVPEEIASIADGQLERRDKDRTQVVHEAIASLEWRGAEGRLDGVRRFKRREMLRVAMLDLAGTYDVEAVGVRLAALADACLEAVLEGTTFPFTVIGMGKLGGNELGYPSDIDVMFVHDGDPHEAERHAEQLMRAIGEVTPEGQAFRIDAALRPEGKSGPLARSFDAFVEYYQRWSQPWEHLALSKARVAAGDDELGAKLVAELLPIAYPVSVPDEALAEIRHLKARMERERIPRGTDPRRHIKLGPGGLSDVEFAIQLIQLRNGRAVPGLRTTSTTAALMAALDEGLIDEDAFRALSDAYSFLTRLRNRLFFLSGRPVDVLPTKPEDLEAAAVAMGFKDQPRQELEEHYLRATRRARRAAEPLIYG